jgi:hypothetical protein
MQVYRQPFETTLTIPIKYVDIPHNIVFDNELPDNVVVRVKDDGAAVFKYFFTKRNDTITIDVEKILKSNKSNVLQNASYEEILRTVLLSSSEIKNYQPVRISLEFAKLHEKKVPVIFDGQILIDQGYLLNGYIKVEPDSVMVYGSELSLKNVSNAYTHSDTIRELKSATTLSIKLRDQRNVTFSPSSVNVSIPIDKYTEKEIIVPVTCINLPQDLDIKIFPSNIKVAFLVGLTQYKSVTENDFSIELDYNYLKDIKEMVTPIRLTSVPSVHIHNITLSPTEIEFVFEKKN